MSLFRWLDTLFSSYRPGALGGHDLWKCERPSSEEAFGAPVNLGPGINKGSSVYDPSLSADGLTLAFDSNRPGRARRI